MRYYVVCRDWRSKPHRTRVAAERQLEAIRKSGWCRREHVIEEGD